MKGSGVPNLSDRALDNHIQDLQSQIDSLHMSLNLATTEKYRRSKHTAELTLKPTHSDQSLKISNSDKLAIGSREKILNKYRGNKNKIETIVLISGKTATINIPEVGNFVKYLNNLELLPNQDEEQGRQRFKAISDNFL